MNGFLNKYKKIISRLNILFEKYWVESYSQEGEDMILRKIFEYQPDGFYVDVGSHHPKKYSNTYYFYKRGWKGINIDAAPGSMDSFNKARVRDINIEVAVSRQKEVLTFYIFEEPALNTFNKELAELHINEKKQTLIKKIKIEAEPLSDILKHNLNSSEQIIDFLSIDVEGYDYEVLLSNDWERFRPRYILIEALFINNFENFKSDKICNFLEGNDYSLFAKTVNTFFFKDNKVE